MTSCLVNANVFSLLHHLYEWHCVSYLMKLQLGIQSLFFNCCWERIVQFGSGLQQCHIFGSCNDLLVLILLAITWNHAASKQAYLMLNCILIRIKVAFISTLINPNLVPWGETQVYTCVSKYCDHLFIHF